MCPPGKTSSKRLPKQNKAANVSYKVTEYLNEVATYPVLM